MTYSTSRPRSGRRSGGAQLEQGWVSELLARRGADGEWPAGRWTATTWTLLLLVALGAPERHPAVQPALGALVDRFIPPDKEVDGDALLKRVDLCHLGFWLGLSAYFLDPNDPRLLPLTEAILSAQFEDGGWNCHMRNHPHRTHSSFHTTFNVLENVRVAVDQGAVPAATFRDTEARAAEFMLAHRLYRSDHTGDVISERFTQLTYPWHWHYTFLRGLDYLRLTPAIRDERARATRSSCLRAAEAERALAVAEADSRHAARGDGEAGRDETDSRVVSGALRSLAAQIVTASRALAAGCRDVEAPERALADDTPPLPTWRERLTTALGDSPGPKVDRLSAALWRRRESNPRPRSHRAERLRA